MFNFTTQTLYNQISTTGANKNMYVAANSAVPALRIGNTRFDKANILDIQIKNPTVENLASVEFDMKDIIPTGADAPDEITARIVLYIGLSMNCQDSLYANDLLYKGKPLYIEFAAKKGEAADIVAKRVKSVADKYLLLIYGEKILNIEVTATAANDPDPAVGKVKIVGVNGYQQIKKAILQKFDPEAITVDCCTTQGNYVDVTTGVPVIYTTDTTGVVTISSNKVGEDGSSVALAANEVAIEPGLEAFGDYNWIIHNLRLPTAANTNFWAPTRGEMPIPGTQYTQFIVRLAKERDGIAGEAVGMRVTSVTTHVLYVAGLVGTAGSAAKAVKDAFTTLLGGDAATKIKTDADTKLVAPFV